MPATDSLFLLSLRYVRPLDEVERFLPEHRDHLQRGYAAGVFLLSGRQEPRTGGIILARMPDRATADAWIAQDPFHREQIAEYAVTQWLPSMAAPGLESLKIL